MRRVPKLPEASNSDKARAVAKQALELVPGYGSVLAQLFDFVVAEPLEKRRAEWLEMVAETINDLCEQVEGLSPEALAADPAFTSTVTAVSAIAIRNHQQEKLTALRNAIAQAALGAIPDYDERAMLLNILDRLTPLHIAVLRFFHEPRADETIVRRFEDSIGGLGMVMEAAIPELRGREAIHDLIWKDLIAAGLVGNASLGLTMSGNGLLTRRTTSLGAALMLFISQPDLLSD